VFWGLDKKLAQRKHFPSVNWNISYSKYMRVLGPFFDGLDPEFSSLRETARDVLQQEKDLSEIVQLVGRDSLSEDQKVVLEIAKILREDYLQQNAFSEHDFNCPLAKSVGMLRVIVALYRRCLTCVTGSAATGAAAAAVAGAKTVTWNVIKATQGSVIHRVTDMKFLDPRTPEAEMARYFGAILEGASTGWGVGLGGAVAPRWGSRSPAANAPQEILSSWQRFLPGAFSSAALAAVLPLIPLSALHPVLCRDNCRV